jgi:hypothetical protein
MDTMYENLYYQSADNPQWDFNWLAFPNIPDVELVPRFKEAEQAVALVPHPTSWWRQKRGDIEKYTTNVCEYLSFSLLSGGLWDGLVVMGYDRDHYFYQNLWFNVLNQGYRMTPVAELDGGYGENNKFPYGTMRVYFHVGRRVTMERIAAAVSSGRTFVTSGPIVLTDVDGKYQVGDVITADGEAHVLNINAYASGESDDYLSYIIVFRNGRVHKLWDVREEKTRHLIRQLDLREEDRAWYAVKVYGRDAWSNPGFLDVMAVCEQIHSGTFAGRVEKENSICITSPFYFRPQGAGDPPVLRSTVDLRLVDPVTKQPVKNATIDVLVAGNTIDNLEIENGRRELTMPVNAMLRIDAPGYPTIRRGLYLDYLPHRRIVETLANGRWLEGNNRHANLQPGQVPWAAFRFEETKKVLSDVEWTIEMRPNERDGLWQEFDDLFE